MTAPALTVEHLHISTTQGVPIVTDVSFELDRGTTAGLIGESGSGKTLTGLACANLLPTGTAMTSGRILINGSVEVGAGAKPSRRQRRRVAMIFQNPMTSLNPGLRVGKQVAEAVSCNQPGIDRRAAMAAAIDLLRQVDLPDPANIAKRWPHQLSGGQRQRVVIAMALGCRADVLIADEPTTALDVTTQAGVIELLERLQAELDMAVLFVSHDLALVSQFCSEALVMYAGELVERGPTIELLSTPRHPYVSGLLGCLPERSSQDLRALPGSVPRPGLYPAGCRFQPRCAFATEACDVHPELGSTSTSRSARCVRQLDIADALSSEATAAGR